MRAKLHARLALALTFALTAASARGTAAAAPVNPLAGETTVAVWNEAALEAIREASVPAPLAARMLAIVNTSMYDAWAAYDERAVGTDGTSRLRRPASERTRANVARAVAIAGYYALRDVAAVPMADVTLSQTGQVVGTRDEPERVGFAAAQAVLAARHEDGSNQLGNLHHGFYSDYTGYRPVNTVTSIVDPSRWQPLLVYNDAGGFVRQRFLVPQWGSVRPFAVNVASFDSWIAPPAREGSSAFVQQARDIIDVSAHLTDHDKAVAEYWADGMMTDSPPGHWVRFGIWISKRDRHDVGTDARMFFVLSNAMLDASISCWHIKRAYDSVRPITAIHALFGNQKIFAWAGPGRGSGWIDGWKWQPYQPADVVTPAFPEYVSGHSTFSAAAAEVFRRFTGSDTFGDRYTQLPGTSIVEPGEPNHPVTLFWPTFTDAADEAGMSRRYGGIHFESGDLTGRRVGRMVGDAVFEKASAMYEARSLAAR